MGINWRKMYVDVEGCKNVKELEDFLVECKVGKNEVFNMMKKALSNYGYNRDYREKRNKSMGSMRSEIDELKKKLSEVGK